MSAPPDRAPAADGPFTRRGGIALAALAIASLVAAGILGGFGDVLSEPETALADGWSPSALGHRAFLALLRDLGIPVIVSRTHTAERGAGAVVALIEPDLGPGDGEDSSPRAAALEDILDEAPAALVVLPKRTGLPDSLARRWLQATRLRPVGDAQRVLARLDVEGEVVRPARSSAWRGPLPAPTLEDPQLLRSDQLVPLVACEDGLLAGELRDGDRHLIVLADPDVLATHGLGAGQNAALAARLVERLGAGPRPLLVDETLHGHELQPSLLRELLQFPLVLATGQALLLAALLAWSALVRFGRPAPPAPALLPGKEGLVASAAELLRQGGHAGAAVAAYLRAAKEAVTARLRPPGETAEADRWLARHAAARGRGEALGALEAEVARVGQRHHRGEAAALQAAQAVHRWREEMIDGAPGDP